MSADPEQDFLEMHLPLYFNEGFLGDGNGVEKCKDWPMQSHQWRTFFVVFDFLDEKNLGKYVD